MLWEWLLGILSSAEGASVRVRFSGHFTQEWRSLVARRLAKAEVAGPNPVSCSQNDKAHWRNMADAPGLDPGASDGVSVRIRGGLPEAGG